MTTAQEITKALAGTWRGNQGACRCPAHEDRSPSLSVREGEEGKVLWHCFSGCSQEAVGDALRARGLLPEAQVPQQMSRRRDNSDAAKEIWAKAVPAAGTRVEVYLQTRGIAGPIPESLRYCAGLKHSGTGLILPAMVAKVTAPNGSFAGIHRTFLRVAGFGKAPVTNNKMALGQIRGGAVRLFPVEISVTLCEGVEDALALHKMTGEPCWAVLGTSGLQSFQPPQGIKKVTLAPDGDNAGQKAAQQAATRLYAEGFEVETLLPPDGQDWCEMLPDFEERAAIREIDGEDPEARANTFREFFGDT